MNKYITLIISLSFFLFTLTGCSEEGQNLDGQKQIQFALAQYGTNENWGVTDEITGDYYNLEKLVSSIHKLKITPKNNIKSKSLSVSLKIGDEIVGYYDEENGEEETHKFHAKLNAEGVYTVTQGNFLHFNEDEVFWGEDVTVLIEHNGETEEIKLGPV